MVQKVMCIIMYKRSCEYRDLLPTKKATVADPPGNYYIKKNKYIKAVYFFDHFSIKKQKFNDFFLCIFSSASLVGT